MSSGYRPIESNTLPPQRLFRSAMQSAEQYRTEKPFAFKYLHVEVIVRLLVHLEVFNPLVERPPDAEVVVVEEEDDNNEIQAGVIRYFEESRGRNYSRRRTPRSSSCWSRRCSTSDGVWTWSSRWDCSSLPFRRLPGQRPFSTGGEHEPDKNKNSVRS